MKELYVLGIGCSTFARVELAIACGYTVAGLYHYNDDRTGQLDHGFRIAGSFDDLFSKDIEGKFFLLTMGDMHIRKHLSEKIVSRGGILPTLIHPTASVSKFAFISPNGVIIDSQAIIQCDCIISEGVFITPQVMVCHQTIIEPYVFVAPKALIGAKLKIGEFAFIGQNATLISSKVKTVGNNAIIGAGAIVTKPVQENSTVIGNPARDMHI